jgi:hypothetical protein
MQGYTDYWQIIEVFLMVTIEQFGILDRRSGFIAAGGHE